MLKTITLPALLLVTLQAIAQTPQPVQDFSQHPRAYTKRYSFWTETNFNGSLTEDKRWQYSFDYQYRRMSDASYIQGGQHHNIFKDPAQQVFRPWLHYWVKPKAVRFSLSPIGYWVTWTPPAEPAANPDGSTGRLVFPEFRICPQVTLVSKIGRLDVQQRYRYEFRFLGARHAAGGFANDFAVGDDFSPNGKYGSNHRGRMRYMVRFTLPLNHETLERNTWYLNAWNEVFLNVGKHVPNTNLLDQNRVVALLGYKFDSEFPVKLELGYTMQTVYRFNMASPPGQPTITYNKNNVEVNNALQVYLVFDEFHRLFKKKQQPAPQPEAAPKP